MFVVEWLLTNAEIQFIENKGFIVRDWVRVGLMDIEKDYLLFSARLGAQAELIFFRRYPPLVYIGTDMSTKTEDSKEDQKPRYEAVFQQDWSNYIAVFGQYVRDVYSRQMPVFVERRQIPAAISLHSKGILDTFAIHWRVAPVYTKRATCRCAYCGTNRTSR